MRKLLVVWAISVITLIGCYPIFGAEQYYKTSLSGYGGFGMRSQGSRWGTVYNVDGDNSWCLGYSDYGDLTKPVCVVSWSPTAITLYQALTLSGNQSITGNQTVTGNLSVTGTGDIAGQFTFGAAGAKATGTVTGALTLPAGFSATTGLFSSTLGGGTTTIKGALYVGGANSIIKATMTPAGALTVQSLNSVGASTLAGDVSGSGTANFNHVETADAADGTAYYVFKTSANIGPTSAASDGIANILSRYYWYTGNNSNAIISGLESVCGSYGTDESITCNGATLRSYIAPGATIRSSKGAVISARASYSGGTEIGAESGTAFIGADVWLAPYFTAVSTPNINNFHGIRIWNEHTTVPVTNGIYLGSGGGGFTKDISLQNGESIDNALDGTLTLTAPNTVMTGNASMTGKVSISSVGAAGTLPATALLLESANYSLIAQDSNNSAWGLAIGRTGTDMVITVIDTATYNLPSDILTFGQATGDAYMAIKSHTLPWHKAVADMEAYSAIIAGEDLVVDDAPIPYSHCRSTGTDAGAWVYDGSNIHCGSARPLTETLTGVDVTGNLSATNVSSAPYVQATSAFVLPSGIAKALILTVNTPTYNNQMIVCSDCTATFACVSTGTVSSTQWVKFTDRAAVCD